jgi:hypothetical protein
LAEFIESPFRPVTASCDNAPSFSGCQLPDDHVQQQGYGADPEDDLGHQLVAAHWIAAITNFPMVNPDRKKTDNPAKLTTASSAVASTVDRAARAAFVVVVMVWPPF